MTHEEQKEREFVGQCIDEMYRLGLHPNHLKPLFDAAYCWLMYRIAILDKDQETQTKLRVACDVLDDACRAIWGQKCFGAKDRSEVRDEPPK